MLEVIAIIAVVIAVAIATVLIIATTKPPTFSVQRAITTKAPPEECAEAIVAAIEGQRFETYTPDMQQFVVGKTGDVDGFLATMAGLRTGSSTG